MKFYHFRFCNLSWRALPAIAVATCMAFSSSQASAQELLGYWRLSETDYDVEDVLDSSGSGLVAYFDGASIQMSKAHPDSVPAHTSMARQLKSHSTTLRTKASLEI